MSGVKQFERLFTVGEANALLPQLREPVRQLMRTVQDIRAEGAHELDDHPLMERAGELIETIRGQGCLCSGPEIGLIDFPCLLGNEVVLLCWRYGEDEVGHWHRLEDGYAGRRPLLDAGPSLDDDAGTVH